VIVDTAAHLEALLPLEGGDCLHGPRTHPAVGHNVKPSLLEHGLDLPDLIRAQVQRGRSASSKARAAGTDRHDRHDLTAMVDNDDVVAYDEVLVSTPRRIDLDERRGDVDHSHARRDQCSDAQREVDIIHPRHVSAGEDCLLNLRALLRGQVHAASNLALLSLALLSLALLTGLALLTLLALGRLTCGLIMLLLALALLGLTLLGLTLLALALHALTLHALLALTLLRLALLTMLALLALALLRLACGLIPLTLLGLALLALLLLGLAGRLLAFLLPLTTLLGLTLLALILRATLCLPGVALLVGCSCRAAFRLRAALGGAAGFTARHVLG
jgi:hypothetical protein